MVRSAVAAVSGNHVRSSCTVLKTCRLLLAAQMPKFRFQFSYARFSGETSCLLFAGVSLSNQTTVPFLFVTQQPATGGRIPEAQIPLHPPQVQIQRLTVRPYAAVTLMPQLNTTVLPPTNRSPTRGSP